LSIKTNHTIAMTIVIPKLSLSHFQHILLTLLPSKKGNYHSLESILHSRLSPSSLIVGTRQTHHNRQLTHPQPDLARPKQQQPNNL
jgi:hypothetical protein